MPQLCDIALQSAHIAVNAVGLIIAAIRSLQVNQPQCNQLIERLSGDDIQWPHFSALTEPVPKICCWQTSAFLECFWLSLSWCIHYLFAIVQQDQFPYQSRSSGIVYIHGSGDYFHAAFTLGWPRHWPRLSSRHWLRSIGTGVSLGLVCKQTKAHASGGLQLSHVQIDLFASFGGVSFNQIHQPVHHWQTIISILATIISQQRKCQ